MSTLINKQLGKYKITEKLGSGDISDIYKGIQIGLEREVAIKVLLPAYAQDPKMVKRFRRESQATARLSHPNIITIYDSGEQEGIFYYVMEHLKADSLEVVLGKEKTLPVARVLKITQDVLKALVYAHEKGVIHRDIKPGNIKFDQRENAILTDFGPIKESGTDESVSMEMTLPKCPDYISPEQASGQEPDARSDIYQLGVVTYQMLTGRLPASNKAAIAGSPVPSDFPAPRDLVSEIPDELSTAVMKALAAKPENRFPTAKDMQADLKKVELRLKARKMSTARQSAVGSTSRAMPVSMVNSTASQSMPAPSSALSVGSINGSLSAILANPADRDAIIKLLSITVPVFVFGLVATLWTFGYIFSKPAPVLLEKTVEPEATHAVIAWHTSTPCYSAVEYWPASAPKERNRTKRLPVLNAEHRHTLPDLKPDTPYGYRLLFSYEQDGDAGITFSDPLEFRTKPEIQISDVYIEEHARKAVITWQTNIKTDTSVRYGKTEEYEEQKSNTDQKYELFHTITLEGLAPNVPYHFQIVATDPKGRGSSKSTNDMMFRTREDDDTPTNPNQQNPLYNLTRSYVDKLTRMTPDEREKLKAVINKFTDSSQPLTAEEKSGLLSRKTDPRKDDEFYNRLVLLKRWINYLKTVKKPVEQFQDAAKQLEGGYYINKVKACRDLDKILHQLETIEKGS